VFLVTECGSTYKVENLTKAMFGNMRNNNKKIKMMEAPVFIECKIGF
jgi:hypothetical protein